MAKIQMVFCLSCMLCLESAAQQLEPRVYASLPLRTNVLAFVYAYSSGNLLLDPSLPIQGATIHSHNTAFGYLHSFGLAKKLARIQVIVPLLFLSGGGTYFGQDTTIARNGFGDAQIRFGINLFGSPALERKDFANYTQSTIVGFSLVTSIPTGLYHKEKLINLGSHRWAFKPEVGISRRFQHVYAEAYAGMWFYTVNNEFLTDKTQRQNPVVSLQAHAAYYFRNQMWIGADGNWFDGGETIVDGNPVGNLKDNWRVGGTWSVPFGRKHSLKFQFHVGAFTKTGYHYNVVSLTYQYIFFGGK